MWEHQWAATLARQILVALGQSPDPVSPWDDNDFDSLLVIRVGEHDGQPQVSFSREQQGLNQLPADCFVPPLGR